MSFEINKLRVDIINDLESIQEMIEDFENEVNKQSIIKEIISMMLKKYKGE